MVWMRSQVLLAVARCRLLLLADHLPLDTALTSKNTISVKIETIHYEMTQILWHQDKRLFNVIS